LNALGVHRLAAICYYPADPLEVFSSGQRFAALARFLR
jgi:hypothetical protein